MANVVSMYIVHIDIYLLMFTTVVKMLKNVTVIIGIVIVTAQGITFTLLFSIDLYGLNQST